MRQPLPVERKSLPHPSISTSSKDAERVARHYCRELATIPMVPNSPAMTTPRARGRPRKAWADLKPRSMRWRITQDPEQCAVLVVATAADEDCKEPKKRGRPRFPKKKLTASGLKGRRYRVQLAARRESDALQPLQWRPSSMRMSMLRQRTTPCPEPCACYCPTAGTWTSA